MVRTPKLMNVDRFSPLGRFGNHTNTFKEAGLKRTPYQWFLDNQDSFRQV